MPRGWTAKRLTMLDLVRVDEKRLFAIDLVDFLVVCF